MRLLKVSTPTTINYKKKFRNFHLYLRSNRMYVQVNFRTGGVKHSSNTTTQSHATKMDICSKVVNKIKKNFELKCGK